MGQYKVDWLSGSSLSKKAMMPEDIHDKNKLSAAATGLPASRLTDLLRDFCGHP